MIDRFSPHQRQIGAISTIFTIVLAGTLIIAFGFGGHGDRPVAFAPDGAVSSLLDLAHPNEHWIDVNRTTARVTLYVGIEPQASFVGKVGSDASDDGFYATALGSFHVYSMTQELAPTSFYPGGYLTDWVGFDPDRLNGFHSPVRDASGQPFSVQNDFTKGCVRLSEDDARAVFAFAELGMRVEVHR